MGKWDPVVNWSRRYHFPQGLEVPSYHLVMVVALRAAGIQMMKAEQEVPG